MAVGSLAPCPCLASLLSLGVRGVPLRLGVACGGAAGRRLVSQLRASVEGTSLRRAKGRHPRMASPMGRS